MEISGVGGGYRWPQDKVLEGSALAGSLDWMLKTIGSWKEFLWSVFSPTVSCKCSDNSAFQCFSFVTKERSTVGAHILPSAKGVMQAVAHRYIGIDM